MNVRIGRGGFGAAVMLAAVLLSQRPAGAREPQICRPVAAAAAYAAGERYGAERNWAVAARWFGAAARAAQSCRSAADVLVSARSLAQAGTALALGGDYLRARALLLAAQRRLGAIGAGDAAAGAAARSYAELVGRVLSAVDAVARSSM